MTPTYLNFSSPSTFPAADDLHHPILFAPNNYLPVSSSSSLSTHIFFGSSSRTQDQSGFYHTKLQHSQIQQDQVNNFASRGGLYDIENDGSRHNGLKFSIWKTDDKYQNHPDQSHDPAYQVKWMSSKMRLMHKMKNVDRMAVNSPPNSTTTSTTLIKLEDQKQQASSPVETDTSSNSNNPIRVCSDCNTTKTPLWRSGPQGPKSLCNACGIRQRKARRAMAAAAAAAENGTAPELTETTPAPKTKTTEQNDKRTISSTTGHVAKFKKRSKLTGSSCRKKLCLEELLRSLSKSLDFHQVFPQDEKDAAILLMALSCDHARV